MFNLLSRDYPAGSEKLSLVCGVLAGITSFSVPALANFVTNGDFATGDFTGWTQSGNTGFSSVCTTNCAGFSSYPGGNYTLLGPVGSLGYLTQSFALPDGQYHLSCLLANNGSPGDGSVGFSASIDGTPLVALTDPDPFGFTQYDLPFFIATDETATLQFSFQNDPSFFGLTQISVEAAPGPIPGCRLALLRSARLTRLRLIWVMGWTPPTASMCQSDGVELSPEGGVRGADYHYWAGHCEACFSGARDGSRGPCAIP